ncbi:MAG: fumarylacetoacetase, partial [Gemmatimonadaceae bacterium]
MLNETHAADLLSWVPGADDPRGDFPVQNLPYGVFRRTGRDEAWRVGVAIGDMIVDVTAAHDAGLLGGDADVPAAACRAPSLNALMALGALDWHRLRGCLSRILRADTPEGHVASSHAEQILVARRDAEMAKPAQIGDYTDFYASVHHATNVGSMFRPDNPLLPNYKWIPIGYHGRASSIVVSGTPVRRPTGQVGTDAVTPPRVGPTQRLDYEAEVGFFVGPGNALGECIDISDAESQLFGVCLLNDWSARDMQAWEYQPLGPFLAKSFATTVSPWVVTLEALAPFRTAAFARPEGDPTPLPHLMHTSDQSTGGLDVLVEVWLRTAAMRSAGAAAERLSVGNV